MFCCNVKLVFPYFFLLIHCLMLHSLVRSLEESFAVYCTVTLIRFYQHFKLFLCL
jgi:hypothetical protein